MGAEVLALFSAASFALSHVVSKRGLQGTSVTAAFIIIVTSAWVVIAIPAVTELPSTLSAKSVTLFALSGLLAPATARIAALAGVHRLGPSIAVPIQQGLRPLLVLPAAALLLGDGLGPTRIIGALIIVAGGWGLARRPTKAAEASVAFIEAGAILVPDQPKPDSPRKRFRPGIIYPLVAAVAYATSDMLVKAGLTEESTPFLGAAISTGIGLSVWYAAHLIPSVRRRFRVESGVSWLILSGTLMGLAILLLFSALDKGDVSLIATLIATQPLFVFLFSTILLRNLEQLNRPTLVAGAMIVLGVALVSA